MTTPLEQTIAPHPKFVDRWARRYLELMHRKGPDAAREWASSFLNPDHYPLVAQRLREIKNGA